MWYVLALYMVGATIVSVRAAHQMRDDPAFIQDMQRPLISKFWYGMIFLILCYLWIFLLPFALSGSRIIKRPSTAR